MTGQTPLGRANVMNLLSSLDLDMRFSLFTTLTEKPGVTGSVDAIYADLIEQMVVADEVGFEAAFVAEHHLAGDPDKGYSVIPNPAVLLSAAAMRTERLRLGPGIVVLPLRNPLQVAEDYAMLDQISGGRLIMGVGAGDPSKPYEYAGLCVDPAERNDRFIENLVLLQTAWQGKPVSYQSAFNRFENATLSILPKQRPSPPLFVAVGRPESAYMFARQGYPIYFVPYPGVDSVIEEFRRGRRDAGLPYAPDMHVLMMNTLVAETEAEVHDLFANAAKRAGLSPDWTAYDTMIQKGNWLVGTVDDVAARIAGLRVTGVTHLMMCMDFLLGMNAEEVVRNMNLFVDRVAPQVADRLAEPFAPDDRMALAAG